MKNFRIIGAAAFFLAGCASLGATQPDETHSNAEAQQALARAMAEMDFGVPYLTTALAKAETLAPPPPAAGSPMIERDEAANIAALAMRDSPRWFLAKRDADLGRGAVLTAFSCAAHRQLSDDATPAIAHLLRRSRSDFARSTGGAKKLYQRKRPFMVNEKQTCTPEAEAFLRRDGSYPSGHSALGYGTGLVLASLFPDRATQLVARGISYGDSRRVCNVHWASDVEAARPMADATFARLWAEPQFQGDFAAAKAEAKALSGPDQDWQPEGCNAESATLATP